MVVGLRPAGKLCIWCLPALFRAAGIPFPSGHIQVAVACRDFPATHLHTMAQTAPVPDSPVLHHDDGFVGDGSVDLRGRPSIKAKTGTWKAVPFVYGVELGDSVGALGIAGNLIFYLTGTLHIPIPDAANIVSYFMGILYLLPLFWGFLADSYFGRYWTMLCTSVLAFVGLVVFTASAAVPALQPPHCVPNAANQGVCPIASDYVLSWMHAGLYLLAIGSAGIKPTITSLGQDQFDQTDPVEKKLGTHFFTGYYVVLNLTTIFCVTVLTYLQTNVSFGWAYGLGTAIFTISILIFLLGTPTYRHIKPSGSAFTRVTQVVVVAVKNYKQKLPATHEQLYELSNKEYNNQAIRKLSHTSRLRCLDKAAIYPRANTDEVGPWDVCTVTQVEELKCVLQILPIWLTTVSVYIMFSQMLSFTIQQGVNMDRHIGRHFTIPAGSISVFMLGTAIIFIPIYETLLVPLLRRLTGQPRGLSDLQRIGVALVLAMLALVTAAVVEDKKVNTIKNHNITFLQIAENKIPLGFYWLIPQYAILGVTEFLVGVSQLNFFYSQAPDNMRSLATSLYFTSISLGYFLSTAIVNLVNRITKHSGGWLYAEFYTGGLRKYYYLLSVALSVNFVVFLVLARCYTYKKLHEGQDVHVGDELQHFDTAKVKDVEEA